MHITDIFAAFLAISSLETLFLSAPYTDWPRGASTWCDQNTVVLRQICWCCCWQLHLCSGLFGSSGKVSSNSVFIHTNHLLYHEQRRSEPELIPLCSFLCSCFAQAHVHGARTAHAHMSEQLFVLEYPTAFALLFIGYRSSSAQSRRHIPCRHIRASPSYASVAENNKSVKIWAVDATPYAMWAGAQRRAQLSQEIQDGMYVRTTYARTRYTPPTAWCMMFLCTRVSA
jgi:hypothetical protein